MEAYESDIVFTDGVKQNVFSVQYTAWLTEIFNSDEVRAYLLNEYGISWDADSEIAVHLNQNSEDGAPYFSIGTTDYHQLDDFFGEKDSLTVATGKTTQERWYTDTFDLVTSDPWGDNPLVIDLSADSANGTSGDQGEDGSDGATGDSGQPGGDATILGTNGDGGDDGVNAVGTGNPKSVAGDGTDGTDGTAGTAGTAGGDGDPGGDGTAGTDGKDGQAAIVVDDSQPYTAILIQSYGGETNVIRGGDGG
ncbi:MAG: hypothetical protein Q8S51_00730, partial [Rhodoferax sp.]|nr:hypothetical protein [Rhodoferax sp.]